MARRALLAAALALPFGGAGAQQTRMWSIGTARMEPDGTIVLDLVTHDGGVAGRAVSRYPRQHPDYAFILRHVGGLSVGQVKAVPPF